MGVVIYRSDIARLLLEMEYLNICARVTRIALRKMIEDQIPEDALRWHSRSEPVEYGEWLEAVRTVT